MDVTTSIGKICIGEAFDEIQTLKDQLCRENLGR